MQSAPVQLTSISEMEVNGKAEDFFQFSTLTARFKMKEIHTRWAYIYIYQNAVEKETNLAWFIKNYY